MHWGSSQTEQFFKNISDKFGIPVFIIEAIYLRRTMWDKVAEKDRPFFKRVEPKDQLPPDYQQWEALPLFNAGGAYQYL